MDTDIRRPPRPQKQVFKGSDVVGVCVVGRRRRRQGSGREDLEISPQYPLTDSFECGERRNFSEDKKMTIQKKTHSFFIPIHLLQPFVLHRSEMPKGRQVFLPPFSSPFHRNCLTSTNYRWKDGKGGNYDQYLTAIFTLQECGGNKASFFKEILWSLHFRKLLFFSLTNSNLFATESKIPSPQDVG